MEGGLAPYTRPVGRGAAERLGRAEKGDFWSSLSLLFSPKTFHCVSKLPTWLEKGRFSHICQSVSDPQESGDQALGSDPP